MDWAKWPEYGPNHISAVERVIRSGQLFAAHEVKAFEEAYARYLGVRFVRGVGNATQGLHLALAAANIGIGDEVIVSCFSWISTASAVLMQNAVPIFCDINATDLGISIEDVKRKTTGRTKAVVVTHMLGFQADIEALARLCRERGLVLIEDASHAHGGSLFGKRLGTYGDMAVFSLHQRKTLSAGDGGIVCTDDPNFAEAVYLLRSFGHDELSYNYRMSEFTAALGMVGLETIAVETSERRENFEIAKQAFQELRNLEILSPRDVYGASHYAIALKVEERVMLSDVDLFLNRAISLGVPIRKTWSPLNRHPHFNPLSPPARGIPWKFSTYQGERNRCYADEYLPIASKILPDRILEVYAHPGTTREAIRELGRLAKDVLG